MARIKSTDYFIEVIATMCGGNPGAAQVLSLLNMHEATIDPDSGTKGLGSIFALDAAKIYDEDIVKLHTKVCDKKIIRVVLVLRAQQLGYLSISILKELIEQGKPLTDVLLDDLGKRVRKELPNFIEEPTEG